MFEVLPKELREGLDAARKRGIGRRSRLRVHAGDQIYPVIRYWEEGFALDADQVDSLRGLVDLFDGGRHLYECLIIASDIEEGELICTMKRATAALDRAPLDFARDEAAPVALLPIA